MTRTIPKFVGMLALFVMALPSLAAAQDPRLPVGLDLTGTWVLDERGELLSNHPAVVKITQTAEGLVRADFASGAECFNGMARPYAFIGTLSFPVPGEASLSAPTMFVCSGSSSEVKRCGGSIPAMYASSFTNVPVMPNFNTGKPGTIAGRRLAQGYDDCTPDSRYDGTHQFILRRETCPVEAQKLADREKDLRDFVDAILGSRATFSEAIAAARERYGDRFNGQHMSVLEYPDDLVSVTWDSDVTSMEVFTLELANIIESEQWKRARDMAAEMGLLANPPLLAVQEMLDRMYQIENKTPDGQKALAALLQARAELAKCQQAERR